ncbi:MAG TPA: hypothetical protein VMR17_00730, partial [Xanthobacteraceae bacterium]|nr:hypothetical protein [Xanthobacteraceae bacterium]
MQSRELPRDEIIAGSEATATAAAAGGGAAPADPQALPAAVLMKLLIQRFLSASREQWNRAARAFAQARARIRSQPSTAPSVTGGAANHLGDRIANWLRNGPGLAVQS